MRRRAPVGSTAPLPAGQPPAPQFGRVDCLKTGRTDICENLVEGAINHFFIIAKNVVIGEGVQRNRISLLAVRAEQFLSMVAKLAALPRRASD